MAKDNLARWVERSLSEPHGVNSVRHPLFASLRA
jgi:hypothetical protein